jgi:predicted acyl esterase
MQQGLTVSIPGLEYGATFESEYELRGMLDLIERDIDEAAFTKEMLFEMLRDCLNMKVSVSNSGGDIDVSVELFLVEEDGTQTLVASDQDSITLD